MTDRPVDDRLFDVAVLGGGPGGYAAALRAAGRGLRVTIVEADRLGGTCLHRGCIPSKALLHVGDLADRMPTLEKLGLARGGGRLDVEAAGQFRDGIVERLHRGLAARIGSSGTSVMEGWGRVVEPGVIEIEGPGGSRIVRADHVVVATGSVPAGLPGVEVDHRTVLTSDDALRLERVPSRSVVVGGGPVGVEFASLWRSLGADVTLVELTDRLLPLEDPDASEALARAFGRRGIAVRTGTSVERVELANDIASVALADGSVVEADQVLVAVGRRPATQDVGLAELGVLDDRGFVEVDGHGRTSVSGLWGVGDAVGGLALAHAAFEEGFTVADSIAGLDVEPVDHAQIPRVTFCSPQVASVGLTESEARAAHSGVEVTKLPTSSNARAVIEDDGGLAKLVTGVDGTILGAHLVGAAATELIAELSLATSWGALTDEVAAIAHPHPTFAEAVRETALAAAGRAFHVDP